MLDRLILGLFIDKAGLDQLKRLKYCLRGFMKSYVCLICGYVYHEDKGVPHEGIAPGTLWADVAEDWLCPDCGAMKDDFEMVEI